MRPFLLAIMLVTFYSSSFANTVPVASGNWVSGIQPAGTVTNTLNYTDPDVGQTFTFTIVQQPTSGVVTLIGGNKFKYTAGSTLITAPTTYTFQWKVNDGFADSNIATTTLYVSVNNRPVIYPSTARIYAERRTQLLFDYSDPDRSQTIIFTATKLPLNGLLEYFDEVSSTYKPLLKGFGVPEKTTKIYYTPNAGFLGTDSFDWQVSDGCEKRASVYGLYVRPEIYGKDWPMYRRDEHRTAETPFDLPDTLYLQWVRELPPLKKAWQAWQGDSSMTGGRIRYDYLGFDGGYEPIVLGKTIYTASNKTDSVVAYDTDTGEEKWRFQTGGPVRVAPVGWKDGSVYRIYFGSDDGYFYCLNAITGQELWRLRLGPGERFFFCNSRLTSMWPVRGGAVLCNEKIYVAAGMIPFDGGSYVYALDARTGSVSWKNDSVSQVRLYEPHSGAGITGLVPQGHLVVNYSQSKLHVPTGHMIAPSFDLVTGKMNFWDAAQTEDRGIASVFVDGDGKPAVLDSSLGVGFPIQVTAGSKVYTTGPGVTDLVYTLIVGDDKLFVVTTTGKIYCFGGLSVTSPPTLKEVINSLPTVTDQWTTAATQMLASNPEGSCLVLGIGSGRLVEELVKQSKQKSLKININVFDPDSTKCANLRQKLDQAGFYGSRDLLVKVDVHCGNLSEMEFPTYGSRIIASEDIAAAGFSDGPIFVQRIFNSLRPYGGTAWLPLSAAEYSNFTGWVGSLSLINASTSQSGGFSLLSRNGELPGSVNYIKTATPAKFADKVAKPPYGVLWAGNDFLMKSFHSSLPEEHDIKDGTIITSTKLKFDVYTGLPFTGTGTWSGAKNVDPSSGGRIRPNPFNGLLEQRVPFKLWGCGGDATDYGDHITFRSGSAAIYYKTPDKSVESGTIKLGVMRPNCMSGGMIPANGVLFMGNGSAGVCFCNYQLNSDLVLVNRPTGYQTGFYSRERNWRNIEAEPIRKLGVNFGGIGERVNNGVLWLHRPVKIEYSPVVPVDLQPEASVEPYDHSPDWVKDPSNMNWVTASGIKGAESIKVNLAYPTLVSLSSTEAPTIDGNLSDACWNGASMLTLYGTDYLDFQRGTWTKKANHIGSGQVQFRYDANNLYVSFKYLGDVSKTLKRKAWDLFISDRNNSALKAVHLGVDDAGVKYQGLGNILTSSENAWSRPWSGVSTKTTTEFIVEMSIPWTTLQAEGFSKNDLVVNVQGPSCSSGGYKPDTLRLRAIYYIRGENLWDNVTWDPTTPYACTRFCPLFLDAPKRDLDKLRTYDISLYFAEPDDIAIGERVFDIQMQGTVVASDVDIVKEAGGVRKAIIKKFTGIKIKDFLDIKLIPKAGVPVVSGVEAIEQGGSLVDITPPTKPTGLLATPISSARIDLTWTKPTDNVGVVRYRIYHGSTLIAAVTGTSYSDVGLTPSTSYSFRVTALDEVDNESSAALVTATTLAVSSADSDGDGLPDTWETANFGSLAQSGMGDFDGDGISNEGEYSTGTSPVDRSSRLAITSEQVTGVDQFTVTWQSIVGKSYVVESSSDCVSWSVAGNVSASTTTSTWTDSSASVSKKFYRVKLP